MGRAQGNKMAVSADAFQRTFASAPRRQERPSDVLLDNPDSDAALREENRLRQQLQNSDYRETLSVLSLHPQQTGVNGQLHSLTAALTDSLLVRAQPQCASRVALLHGAFMQDSFEPLQTAGILKLPDEQQLTSMAVDRARGNLHQELPTWLPEENVQALAEPVADRIVDATSHLLASLFVADDARVAKLMIPADTRISENWPQLTAADPEFRELPLYAACQQALAQTVTNWSRPQNVENARLQFPLLVNGVLVRLIGERNAYQG